MKIKIIPKITLAIEIDGEQIPGEFKLDGLWNGFACLRSTAPCRMVIIDHPRIGHLNVYDSVLKLFGGNAESSDDIKPVEVDGIRKDFDTPSESRERRAIAQRS